MLAPDSPSGQERLVLRFLAHAGCATRQHLHGVGFAPARPDTVSTRLRGLYDNGWITHTPWQLSYTQRVRGHIWTITRAGLAVLTQLDHAPVPSLLAALGRPRTVVEMEEWEARLAVRSLLVRLIVAARHRPLLAHLRISMPPLFSTLLADAYVPTPDADLAITWDVPARQASDWLPWPARDPAADRRSTYALYMDRASLGDVDVTLDRCRATLPPTAAAMVLWASDVRLEAACAYLRRSPAPMALRMTACRAVTCELDDDGWLDAAGDRCSLQLRPQDMTQIYHDVPAA